jgi:hypothetical protein
VGVGVGCEAEFGTCGGVTQPINNAHKNKCFIKKSSLKKIEIFCSLFKQT